MKREFKIRLERRKIEMQELKMEDIFYFQEKYSENKENKNIENKIKTLGLKKASIQNSKKYEFKFNIEVPEVKIYNQQDSVQCNIYAFLRVVKDILRKNSDLKVENMDFSSTYIGFYDKLEKANVLYNTLIECPDLSIDTINTQVNRYIGNYGTFHFCAEIVDKYGLVPTPYMREVNENYNHSLTFELLKDKIKGDALSLLSLKTKEERKNKKKELLYEVYTFLAKIYGNPPTTFMFQGKEMTPLSFKNQYIGDSLDDYVTVTSLEKEAFLESYSFVPCVYLKRNEQILYVSTSKMREAVLSQLKDNISVWFSSEETTMLDYDENILDDKMYNFSNLLHIKNVSKNKKILLDMIGYDHAMCITGVLMEEGEVKQFKVDNSFGLHGKYNGRLIMTPSFFENGVLTCIINKKYL